MKLIKYEDIKTPKTVEEFRENLRKYFVTINDREYVVGMGANHTSWTLDAKIDDLNSVSDLYDCGIEWITPTIDCDVKDITHQEILTNMFNRDFSSVLSDDKRFPIYEMENQNDCFEYTNKHNPMWYRLSNQILRDYFIKTLGNFSGYGSIESQQDIYGRYKEVGVA